MSSTQDGLPHSAFLREPEGTSWGDHLFRHGSASVPVYRFVSACIVASAIFVMFTFTLLLLSGFGAVSGAVIERQATTTSSVPQWFQTTPELFAGQIVA